MTAAAGAHLRLRSGRQVRGLGESAGEIEIVADDGEVLLSLGSCGAGARAALDRLGAEGGSRQELLAVAVEAEGHAGAPKLVGLLDALAEARLLCLRAEHDGRTLAVAIPATPEALRRLREEPPPGEGRLAAHGLIRRVGSRLVLESALDDVIVELLDTSVLPALARLPEVEVASSVSRADAAIVDLLWRVGLWTADEEAETAGDGESGLGAWELHDLVFHARSRALGRRRPYGGTNRLLGRREPLPAVRPRPEGPRVPLPRPAPSHDGPSFESVLAARRSQRRFGNRPIGVAQLGELLHRAARVRRLLPAGSAGGAEHYEVTDRPYSGGGAAYELEVYPVVDRCEGLEPGLHHYSPLDHELTRMAGRTPAVEALLESAARTAGSERPQVLLVFAARFERIFWKYSAIGYATLLKDVGVLMQTLSLVATAMGLASCPLGGGSARRFAEASGLDPLVEGSVGELIVGSRAGDDS